MKLLLENWRNHLHEAEKTDELEVIMDQAFAGLVGELEKIEPSETEQELDEIAATMATGAALVVPQVLEGVGKVLKWAEERLEVAMGDIDPSDPTFGSKLIELGEWLHHKYTSPLTFIAERIFPDKDKEWVHKWVNRLFHVIIAGFLLMSGIGALKAFKHASHAAGAAKTLALNHSMIEGAMAAIKGSEIAEFLALHSPLS